MKFLVLIGMTVLFVSCGSGGGGGGSGSPAIPGGAVDFSDRAISNYELKINACPGTTVTMVAFTDPGTPDEVRHDFNMSISGTGTSNVNIQGRAIEWETNSISGNCTVNMLLTRTTGGVTFVATDSIPSNGMSGFIQDY